MTQEPVDPGDQLVSQVVATVGALTPDEHAAVYGAGYSYGITGTSTPAHRDNAAWIATLLGDFRARPCPFCHHGLLEHSLAITDAGPSLTCDADGSTRPAYTWHTGPVQQPAGRVALGAALWVGLPLISIGLAGWLMPAIAAAQYRERRWILGSVFWAALTIVLVIFIENESVSSIMGFLALFQWFGSAIYGGFQVKAWLDCLPPPRPN